MKLRDLDAQFVDNASSSGCHLMRDSDVLTGAQGVMFQCPACAVGKEAGEEDGRRFVRGAHYIRIYFSNPQGVDPAPQYADANPRWEVSGHNLDDLTLSPSINLDVGENPGCRWHGWVKNGDAA